MNDKPLVSVIIPVYNSASTLSQAIDSVLEQTYSNFEIIAVNDGSTDNSLELLKGYDSKIRLITQANAGVATARNRAIAEANGELVAFLDSDDWWLPHKLARQVAFLQKHPKIDLVHSAYQIVDENDKVTNPAVLIKLNLLKSDEFAQYQLVRNLIGILTVCLWKRILPTIPFDDQQPPYEDWDLWAHLISKGYKVGYQPEVLASYRVNLQSSTFQKATDVRTPQIIEQILSVPLDFLPAKAARWVEQRRTFTKETWFAALSYRRGQLEVAAQQLGGLTQKYEANSVPLGLLATFASLMPGVYHTSKDEKRQADLVAIDFAATAIQPVLKTKQWERLGKVLVYLAKARVWQNHSRHIILGYVGRAVKTYPGLLWDKRIVRPIGRAVLVQIKTRWHKLIYILTFR